PAAAAVGRVVDLPVAAEAPRAEVVDVDLDEPLVLRPPQDRVLQRAPDKLRQHDDEVDAHGGRMTAGGGRRAPRRPLQSKSPSGGSRRRRPAPTSTARTISGTSGTSTSGTP